MNADARRNAQMTDAIDTLVAAVPDPHRGLPDAVFYYVSRTTPLVNVDLLIKDGRGRTLLAWRDDPHAGTGWHVPGGIIRFQETMAERIEQVAQREIGTRVACDPTPIAINEMIHRDRQVRGHFISLLFNCRLDAAFVPDNGGREAGDPGYLAWHDTCPANLIAFHDVYRRHIG